jgi:hypothetical protein
VACGCPSHLLTQEGTADSNAEPKSGRIQQGFKVHLKRDATFWWQLTALQIGHCFFRCKAEDRQLLQNVCPQMVVHGLCKSFKQIIHSKSEGDGIFSFRGIADGLSKGLRILVPCCLSDLHSEQLRISFLFRATFSRVGPSPPSVVSPTSVGFVNIPCSN